MRLSQPRPLSRHLPQIRRVLACRRVRELPRSAALSTYGLNPAHYFTLPGFSWDALLKTTDIELQLFTDIDKHLYVRPGNGSISHSGSRPDNGSKTSKFGFFTLLTLSCWWYSKEDLLYILGSMFVTLLDENCMLVRSTDKKSPQRLPTDNEINNNKKEHSLREKWLYSMG